MPKSWVKVNKNCDVEADICHNTTRLYNLKSENTIVYQGSMRIFNLTFVYQESKKILKNKELGGFLQLLTGLVNRGSKIGMKCRNSTIFKFENSAKTIKLLFMSTNDGQKFQINDNAIFDNGSSCIEITFVAQKY